MKNLQREYFVHPTKPEKKRGVKKEYGTVTKVTLEKGEYRIEMEVYFYKFKLYF